MPTFSGGNGAFTPSTTNDNWTIDAVGTGVFGKVVELTWGGSGTSSIGYRTRWTRPTAAGVGAKTALTLGFRQPNYATAAFTLTSTYATTQPTLAADPAGNVFSMDWNVQGGGGVYIPPLNNPIWVSTGVLQGALSCRNTKGTDASLSSYQVTWEE